MGYPCKEKYVLKRYKEDKVAEIKEIFGTTEAHTRKVIQMNALASNFAQNYLDLQRPPVFEYGLAFRYSKVYYANFNISQMRNLPKEHSQSI